MTKITGAFCEYVKAQNAKDSSSIVKNIRYEYTQCNDEMQHILSAA